MKDGQSEQRASNGNSNLRPWVKGQSGNPGGRPKGIEARAREHTDRALETLVAALDDPDPRIRVTAAGLILDRGWGKAKQTVAGDPEDRVQYVIRVPTPIDDPQEWLRLYAPPGLGGEITDGEAKAAAPERSAQTPSEPELAPPPAPAAASARVSPNSSDLQRAAWLAEFNRDGSD